MKSIVEKESGSLGHKDQEYGTLIGKTPIKWLMEAVPKQSIGIGNEEECAVMVNAKVDAYLIEVVLNRQSKRNSTR
eukprot:CAMPEP_0198138678 /NCGR_PEP_ID=MMETSP1443-20131203/2077_1 /TAXON_ID=186043 /ORGANISM="Entomoneis sp., Strain CCMP2396" /LENGTH=75 /DNA_ID=CAMNT_0043800563 /DNA_START=856 /DNA_END=1080 /DNA_ORIENTATION=-